MSREYWNVFLKSVSHSKSLISILISIRTILILTSNGSKIKFTVVQCLRIYWIMQDGRGKVSHIFLTITGLFFLSIGKYVALLDRNFILVGWRSLHSCVEWRQRKSAQPASITKPKKRFLHVFPKIFQFVISGHTDVYAYNSDSTNKISCNREHVPISMSVRHSGVSVVLRYLSQTFVWVPTNPATIFMSPRICLRILN
jgi:hypothetical protein